MPSASSASPSAYRMHPGRKPASSPLTAGSLCSSSSRPVHHPGPYRPARPHRKKGPQPPAFVASPGVRLEEPRGLLHPGCGSQMPCRCVCQKRQAEGLPAFTQRRLARPSGTRSESPHTHFDRVTMDRRRGSGPPSSTRFAQVRARFIHGSNLFSGSFRRTVQRETNKWRVWSPPSAQDVDCARDHDGNGH